MEPVYFSSPAGFRKWLKANHAKRTELIVGFYKKHVGKPTMTWSESVDEALCFGWIDGIARSVDDERYTRRFTPRKKKSHWSTVNVKKVEALIAAGRMSQAGMTAWEARDEENTAQASFERDYKLPAAWLRAFKANTPAWSDWQSRAPSYRRLCVSWVMQAKQETTRQRRMDTLIACCVEGSLIPPQRYGRNKASPKKSATKKTATKKTATKKTATKKTATKKTATKKTATKKTER